mgnify:CR=1 FL=1
MSTDPARIRQAFDRFKRRYKWSGTLEETQANPLAAAMLRALANSVQTTDAPSELAASVSPPVAMGLSIPTAPESARIVKPRMAAVVDRKRLAANDRDD